MKYRNAKKMEGTGDPAAGTLGSRWRWLAPALLLVLTAAACGEGDTTAGEPADEPADTEPADADEPAADEPAEDEPEDEAEAAAEGEEITIRYASFIGPASSFIQQVNWWMEEVQSLVPHHQIEFEEFLGGALVPAEEMLAAVEDGRTDAAHVAAPYHPGELPLSQVAGVPFISSNGEAYVRAVEDMYESNEAFRAEYDNRGVKVLGWALATSATTGLNEPVEGLGDLSGKRLRAVGLIAEALQARGVDPVLLGAPEIYESVERGVVDGYSGLPFQIAMDLSMHEVAPHTIETGLGVFAIVPVISMRMDVWESLPADVQDAMLEAGEGVTDQGVEVVTSGDEAACDTLLDAGGSVVVVPDDEVEQWREEVQDTVLDSWVSDAVSAGLDEDTVRDFYDTFVETVQGYEDEVDYVDGLRTCAERS